MMLTLSNAARLWYGQRAVLMAPVWHGMQR
jgi:hypothetical protein